MPVLNSMMAAVAVQAAVAGVPPQYTVTILPQLDDTDSEFKLTFTAPFALNDVNQVVGDLGNQKGFSWSPTGGGLWLQPMFASQADRAVGTAVNNSGDIAGTFWSATTSGRAFHLTSDGTFTALPSLGADLSAGAADMNESGLIVGSGERELGGTFGGPTSSLYWENGTLHDIGGFGGETSRATAVNNKGVIVGYSNDGNTLAVKPYMWTHASGMVQMQSLVSGVASTPADINDRGIAVGRGGVSNFQNKAVYWTADGLIHELPGLYSDAFDIGVLAVNESNVMVGHELNPDTFTPEARLWLDEQVYDLTDLTAGLPEGYALQRAVDVNENGVIAVEAAITIGGQIQLQTILLTPTSVPAPGAVALLGLGGLSIRHRRRRAA